MPELPEVETIKSELSSKIVGCIIIGITLLWMRMLHQPSPEEFHSRIVGNKIIALARRGKYLIFRLDSGNSLIIHLRMSGTLILGGDSMPKYVRMIIHLNNGIKIFFCDPRKFGRIQLVRDEGSVTSKLGLEPLEQEFTIEALGKILCKRKAPVKAILLQQTLIAGIGNMYADESLFAANINPLKPAYSLSLNEMIHLHKAIQSVLRGAIDSKGASVSDYFRPGGKKGTAHYHFKVAHKRGKLCPVCGSPIKRITICQRGSYYCPECQPEELW